LRQHSLSAIKKVGLKEAESFLFRNKIFKSKEAENLLTGENLKL
jgi:hypothetical protein